MKTVADILRAPEINTLELSFQEKQLLLEGLLGLTSIEILRDPERPLSKEDISNIYDCFQRLGKGEPIPYIIGYTYFDSLKIEVSPQVLIPRPDSEIIIHTVLEAVDKSNSSILDLCTGTGAIGLALKYRRPGWKILATDISSNALKIARKMLLH